MSDVAVHELPASISVTQVYQEIAPPLAVATLKHDKHHVRTYSVTRFIMSSPKVLIIGCGMAGPVVACLLKQKGYAPIIFERSPAPADVGASLMICPNGLKVLNLIGPVPDWLLQNGPPVLELCDYKASGEVLGRSDVPTEFAKRYGQPAVGVKRTLVTEWLRELAVESGVEVREGWKLEQIQEGEDSVTAFFEGGTGGDGVFFGGV